MRNQHIQHEAYEQELLINWAEIACHKYTDLKLLYHIPNGGSRNAKEAANLKKQGVRAGVPDLCLPSAHGGFHGLYIEMKYGKNKPTAKQKEWLHSLEEQGYKTAVCYSLEEAQKLLKAYITSPKTNINK